MNDDTKPNEPPPEGSEWRRFVVLPTWVNKDGKKFVSVALVENVNGGNDDGYGWIYALGKDNRRLCVGHEYWIPFMEKPDGGKSLYFGRAKWVGQHADRARVVNWQAAERAATSKAAAQAREKREATDDSALRDALEPLAAAYQKLPYPSRLGFEVWVLSVLRRGG